MRRVAVWLATGTARADSHQDHCVLDHIDADAANNRRDNLRLICPTCDSQLPTLKMRNKGKGRHSRRQWYADRKSYPPAVK